MLFCRRKVTMLLGQEVPNQESHHSSAMFDYDVMSFIQTRRQHVCFMFVWHQQLSP